MTSRLATATLVVALAFALTGCSKAAPPTTAPTAPAETTAAAPAVQPTTSPAATSTVKGAMPGAESSLPAKAIDMSPEKKTKELNKLFPSEFPVIDGKVISSIAVSQSELQYEILTKLPASDVERWYRALMMGRAFNKIGEQQKDGGLLLGYARGNVQYYVFIKSEGESKTRVFGRLGTNLSSGSK